jgi:hypothetical protein
MGYYPHKQTSGVRAAVAIHLGVYCAVAGCFAYGLHALLEPLQLANPGVSAYKPPPGTVITYVPAHSQATPLPVAETEPEPQPEPVTTATTKATPAPAATEKPKRTVKVEKPRRARTAKARRNPREDYAYQPSFFWGGYRPWY